MKSKKSLIVLIVAVLVVAAAVIAVILNKDHSKGMNAVPASNTVVYDTSYKNYLDQNGYGGTTLEASLQIELKDYQTTDGMTAEI